MNLTVEISSESGPYKFVTRFGNVSVVPHVGDSIVVNEEVCEIKIVFFDYVRNEILIRCRKL